MPPKTGETAPETEVPINERRSIPSHTDTEFGRYDAEPFPTEGNAYHWYVRACYWKRTANRNEGVQQTLAFEPNLCLSGPQPGPTGRWMTANDREIVRAFIKSGHNINAIKTVREITALGLKASKDYVDKLRDKMGWNGSSPCTFTSPNVDLSGVK